MYREVSTNGTPKAYDIIRDNRTAVVNGTDFEPNDIHNTDCCQALRCIAAIPENVTGMINEEETTLTWLKDGQPLSSAEERYAITNNLNYYQPLFNQTRFRSDLRLTPFLQSEDVGVYQCLFSISGELVITTPFRLDSGTHSRYMHIYCIVMYMYVYSYVSLHFTEGDAVQLTALTAEDIVVAPSEKLVIEVKSTGGYFRHAWFKNDEEIYPNGDTTFMQTTPQDFSEFFQVYVKDPVETSDYGVYRVELIDSSRRTITSQVFRVTPYGELNID